VANTGISCHNRGMHKIKSLIKQLLPANARRPLLNFYHLLVAIAANVRFGFPARGARVIMVTGTNGKTTTAALIAQMLTTAGHKVGAITTAFYAFGEGKLEPNTSNRTVDDIFKVHALLKRMQQAGCTSIVIEVTSQALDQHRLWGVPCDVAVMTNLTQDHLDYHGTMERYAAAKGKLFARSPRLIVLNRDDEWFDFFNAYEASERKVTYGVHKDATCQIMDVTLHKDGSDVTLKIEDEHELKFRTALPGRFNVYNATAAAAVGYYLMLEPEQVAAGINALASVPGRLERIEAGQKFEVIVDYAHTPDALQNLLDTLKHLTKGKLWLVFGATGDRDKGKRPIMGEIAARLADQIIVTDEEPYNEDPAAIRRALLDGIEQGGGTAKTQEIADRREAIAAAMKGAKAGDTVAITGMGHEQFRIVAGERQPWSDAEVARDALKQ
jgi:UDP-N-acetylmuramoyl-L-alanyl-D-glutamate--2,6-diaminopimelate ligase